MPNDPTPESLEALARDAVAEIKRRRNTRVIPYSEAGAIQDALMRGASFDVLGRPGQRAAISNAISRAMGSDLNWEEQPPPTQGRFMTETVPEMVGWGIGGPGALVKSVGSRVLSRMTGGATSAALKTAGSEAAAQLSQGAATKSALKLISRKAVAEGIAGTAYGVASGLFEGKRGEELAKHVAVQGAFFTAFGAAEIPMAAGFLALARKWGKSAGEVMRDIAEEAIEAKSSPGAVIAKHIEANLTPGELADEFPGTPFAEGLKRQMESVKDIPLHPASEARRAVAEHYDVHPTLGNAPGADALYPEMLRNKAGKLQKRPSKRPGTPQSAPPDDLPNTQSVPPQPGVVFTPGAPRVGIPAEAQPTPTPAPSVPASAPSGGLSDFDRQLLEVSNRISQNGTAHEALFALWEKLRARVAGAIQKPPEHINPQSAYWRRKEAAMYAARDKAQAELQAVDAKLAASNQEMQRLLQERDALIERRTPTPTKTPARYIGEVETPTGGTVHQVLPEGSSTPTVFNPAVHDIEGPLARGTKVPADLKPAGKRMKAGKTPKQLKKETPDPIPAEMPSETPSALELEAPAPKPKRAPKTPAATGELPIETPSQSPTPRAPSPVVAQLSLSSKEADDLVAAVGGSIDTITPEDLIRNAHELRKETVAELRKRTALELQHTTSAEERKTLREHLMRLKVAERSARASLPGEVGTTPTPLLVQPQKAPNLGTSVSFPAGTRPPQLQDVYGNRLKPGAQYTVRLRYTRGGRELSVTLSGTELGRVLKAGTHNGESILAAREVIPIDRGISLRSGLPLDAESLGKLRAAWSGALVKLIGAAEGRAAIDDLVRAAEGRAAAISQKLPGAVRPGEAILTKEMLGDFSDVPPGQMGWLARHLASPAHAFRKYPAIAKWVEAATVAESKLAARVEQLSKRYKQLRSDLQKTDGEDGLHNLHALILEVDAFATQERAAGRLVGRITSDELRAMGHSQGVVDAYNAYRRLMNLVHRQGSFHERAMATTLQRRLRDLRKQALSLDGDDLARVESEISTITERLNRSRPGYLEGYFPRHFLGEWRVVAIHGEGAAPETLGVGFLSPHDALKAGRKIIGADTKTRIVAMPRIHDYAGQTGGVVLDRPSYFMLKTRLEKGLALTEDESRQMLEGVTRLASRRKVFGHFKRRLGVEGFLKDVDEAVELYLQQSQAYILRDHLKHTGLNIAESLGQKTPVRAAFDNLLRDVLRQKGAAEQSADAMLKQLFRHRVFRGLDEILSNTSDTPGLRTLSRAGRNVLNTDYPSRALVNNILSTTTHLKLGGFWNIGSAAVNLSQVLLNTYPILGERYTAAGYDAILGGYLRKGADWKRTTRLLERAGITVVQPKYEAGVMLNRNTFERVSLAAFNSAEQLNRAVTFMGKYRQMLDLGASPGRAFEAARDLTLRTQFVYGPSTNPALLRGLFTRIPAQFRGFYVRQLGFLFGSKGLRSAGPAGVARFLAATTALGGIMGWPGVDSLDEVSNWLFGYSPLEDMRLAYLQQGQDLLDPDATGSGLLRTFLTKGAGAVAGLDFSQRIGFGDILPVRNFDMLYGPAISTVMRAERIWREQGDPLGALASTSVATEGVLTAVRASRNDNTLTSLVTGKPIARNLTKGELLARTVNFPTRSVAKQYDAARYGSMKQTRELRHFTPLIKRWAVAHTNGDTAREEALLARILQKARKEGIDMSRIETAARRSLEELQQTPTERMATRAPLSVRQNLTPEMLQ